MCVCEIAIDANGEFCTDRTERSPRDAVYNSTLYTCVMMRRMTSLTTNIVSYYAMCCLFVSWREQLGHITRGLLQSVVRARVQVLKSGRQEACFRNEKNNLL